VRELDARRAEPGMADHAPAEVVAHHRGERDGVALDDQVDVGPVGHAEEGVAHRPAHQAHAGRAVRPRDA